jgi:hypothetical protein
MSRRTLRALLIVGTALALLGVAGPAAPGAALPAATGTLTTSAAETVWSQYLTLTATPTVPRGEPKPIGTVTFADEDGVVGSADLANGVARFRTKALPVGAHLITATLDDAPIGEAVGVTVAPAATTTTLVSKKAEVASGDTAWFQATVAPVAPATSIPTGSVAFTVDGAGTPAATVPLVGGTASWRPRLPDGLRTAVAAFAATESHQASSSTPVTQRIGTPPTTHGPLDQSFEPPATGNAFGVGGGSVWHQTFTVGRTGLLDRVDARMSSWMQIAPVTISVLAVDGTGTPTGPVLASGTTTVPDVDMVDRVIDVRLEVPLPVRAGERYALRYDSPVDSIAIDRGIDDGYPGGSIRMLFQGDFYDFPGDIWFRTYVTSPTAAVGASSGAPVWSQYVDLTTTWTVPSGAPTPTGTVTFAAGGTAIGTAPIVGRTARLRTKALPAGSNEVTASYSGDEAYSAAALPGSANVTVAPATTTTTLVSKKTEVLSGTAWFQARVATVAPATSAPGGSVAFYLDGATEPAATVPLGAGLASWRPRLADGPHTVVASYVPSAQGGASTSEPVEQSIGTPASSPVDQSNAGPGTGYEFIPAIDLFAQSFTVGRSGLLESVSLAFEDAGQTVSVDIWTDGTIQPGVSTGAAKTIQTQQGTTTVVFDTPIPVQAGEPYYIVIDASQAVGDTPRVSTTGDTYSAGTAASYDGSMGMWNLRPWQDLVFSTTVRPA